MRLSRSFCWDAVRVAVLAIYTLTFFFVISSVSVYDGKMCRNARA